MIESILEDELLASAVILISQIGFIYCRTINVIYTAEKRIIPAVISGNGIGLFWLVSMSIGLNSVMDGQILPIMAFLLGGSLGTWWGIVKEKNSDEYLRKDFKERS